MLTYFLQVNLCWLLFYGLYYALLSKETFFKLNRFYLIISLLAGLFMPIISSYQAQWVNMPAVMPIAEIVQPIHQNILVFQDNIDNNWSTPTPQSWNLGLILRGGYLLGVIFFFTRFFIGLFKIYQLFRTAATFPSTHFTLVQVEGLSTPFSFFHWIFIDRNRYTPLVLEPIIEHEKAHVLQKHSWDIFFIEILRGVFWGSPLIYLFANSIRHVHEYLADEVVLRQTEKKTYGLLLVNQAQTLNQLLFVNHFNLSQLKKRFIMMSRNPSQNKALAKYILATPIFLFLFSAFIKPNNIPMEKVANLGASLENMIDRTETPVLVPISTTPLSIKEDNKDINQLAIIKDTNTQRPLYVHLAGKKGGVISPILFKNQLQLNIIRQQGDRPFICAIQSFALVHKPSQGANKQANNLGQKFSRDVLDLIQKAQNGDIYEFKFIKGRCPNDSIARDLGEMTFFITDNPTDSLFMVENSNLANISESNQPYKTDDCGFKLGDKGQFATFPGGNELIEKFIYDNLKYPEVSKKQKREGIFFITYIVGSDGLISNVKSWKWKWANPRIATSNQKRIPTEIDDQPMIDEAIRVIRSMPKWTPGTKNGVISCQNQHAVIKFQLEN